MTVTVLLMVLIVLVIIVAFALSKQISSLGPKNDFEKDKKIDAAADEALASYQRHLEKLQNEKKQLPQIDLWAIDSNRNWERELIVGAENLRDLLITSYAPHTHDLQKSIDAVPMTYNFAHDLAELAHLKKDIAINETEWILLKLKSMVASKKHEPNFFEIIDHESELRELDRRSQQFHALLPQRQQAAYNAYRAAEKEAGE